MITNMSTLRIDDAAATPVQHAFTPASRVSENTARWVDREHNGGVAIGFSTITFSVKEPATADGVTRLKITLSVPKVDFTNPNVPLLLGVMRANTDFIFPGIVNDQERKNFTQMFTELFTQNSAWKLGDNIVAMSTPY